MKCWHCNTELIWGGDHDIEEENDTYSIVTNLSCPNCNSFVEVYYPNEQTKKEYKDYEKS
jgi:RNase P subunit RPR2